MHIGDHSTVFGRVRVHWSIHVEMSELVRLSMNYEDSNWFKSDGIELGSNAKSARVVRVFFRWKNSTSGKREGLKRCVVQSVAQLFSRK